MRSIDGRLVHLETIARRPRPPTRFDPARLTPDELDEYRALEALADAVGGLDHLTDEQVERGAELAEKMEYEHRAPGDRK